jgi:hypothetical protein
VRVHHDPGAEAVPVVAVLRVAPQAARNLRSANVHTKLVSRSFDVGTRNLAVTTRSANPVTAQPNEPSLGPQRFSPSPSILGRFAAKSTLASNGPHSQIYFRRNIFAIRASSLRGRGPTKVYAFMWHPVSTAPFDHDLELAIIDSNGVHATAVPCRRILAGWMMGNKTRIDVCPTHWRD